MIGDLQSYFEEKFPQWDDIIVLNLVDITSGWETEIVSFDVQYSFQNRQKIDNLIARVYPGSPGAYRAKVEFDLLESLHIMGYPVPNVLLVDTESKIFERPFIIMERVVGSTMMDLMNNGDEIVDSHMMDLFSKLFVQLHNLDWRKIPIVPERYHHSNFQTLFTEHLINSREHITKQGVAFLSPIIDWLLEHLQEIEPLSISLLHRDFHPMNILIDTKGNPYVIDWTAAMIGDPRIDVAWSLLLAKLHIGDGLYNVILDGYQKVTGLKLENLDYFMVDACLRRLSDILISLSKGADSLGMREDTADEMKMGIGLLEVMHDTVKRITGVTISEIKTQVEYYRAG